MRLKSSRLVILCCVLWAAPLFMCFLLGSLFAPEDRRIKKGRNLLRPLPG